jgi:transcription elongation GreA/GreB family factor
MSRAFMKERDDLAEPALVVERVGPVQVTAAGLAALRAQFEAAAGDAERARLARVLEEAQVVGPPDDRSTVGFGATVSVDGAAPSRRTFTLVGDVEADPAAGRIGMGSPLAEALLGHRVGETVVWHRPAGDRTLIIRGIAY